MFGVHCPEKVKSTTTGIPTSELPWAEPAISVLEGAISGFGVFGVPLQGSHVFVFFENGNPMKPIYFAAAPGIPMGVPDNTKGFSDPNGVYPTTERMFEPDWDGGTETNSVYPHDILFRAHGGHEIEVDSTPGYKRYRMYHPSGTVIVVDNSGNVDISVVSNETRTITINRTTTIGGDDTTTISGDQSNNVTGNLTEVVAGDDKKSVTGSSSENVVGDKDVTTAKLTINVMGECSIIAGGTVTIDSPSVMLGTGPRLTLLNSRAADVYNSHTHDNSSTPNQTITADSQTTITKAA